MRDTLFRLVWFTIVACVLSYVVFVVTGRFVFALASGENEPTVIRDELSPGSHHLFGMIMVPSTCDELQEHLQAISDYMYELQFTTWQDSSVPCDNQRTPRAFHEALFAPAVGVDFVATLDGAPLPITVQPFVPTQ